MARPRKEGLDYFPMDIVFDDKVGYIEGLHGANGIYIWLKLLQKIYAKGYFLEWTQVSKVNFKRETEGLSMSEIQEIVEDCLVAGLFDERLFHDHQIITSQGIQKRFFEVAKRREEVVIVEDYIVFDKMRAHFCEVSATETPQKPNDNEGLGNQSDEETQQEPEETTGFSNDTEDKTQQKRAGGEGLGEVSSTEVHTGVRGKHSIVKNSKGKNSNKKNTRANQPPKIAYAENVSMTEVEYQKLIDRHGQEATDWMIEKLDNYKGSNGKKYRNDYRAILNWVVEKYQEQAAKRQVNAGRSEVNDSIEPDLRQQDWNNW